jgi:hypothetical protein
MLRRHHLLLLRYREFQDLEIIHLPQVREWEFLARWQDLETIRSIPLRVWLDRAHQDPVRQDLEQDLKVDRHDLGQDQPVPVDLVQDSVQQSPDSVAVLPVEDSQEEDLPVVAVAVLAEELLVRLVKVALAEAEEPVSQSAQREKNSNKEVSRA